MANSVKSKYIEFLTSSFFEELIEKDFSEDKFNKMYSNHPSRMTSNQIKGIGYDVVKSRLHSQWIDKKYQSLWTNEVAVAEQVIDQIGKVIKEKFPKLGFKQYAGEVKKYGERKIRFPKIIVGDIEKEIGLTIIPTLTDKDNEYFSIGYNTPYFNESRYCNDIELINEIDKFNTYMETLVEPTINLNKVRNKCENQYEVVSGKNSIGLYDICMITLYHTLAKEMNKCFGTNYEYNEDAIKRLYKVREFGNIKYNGGFVLDYINKNGATLKEFYFYEDDKTKKPDFKCWSTYGEWTKEELIELLDTLFPYVKSDYFFNMSKDRLGKKYSDYDRIGIGYDNKPDYFELLKW